MGEMFFPAVSDFGVYERCVSDTQFAFALTLSSSTARVRFKARSCQARGHPVSTWAMLGMSRC